MSRLINIPTERNSSTFRSRTKHMSAVILPAAQKTTSIIWKSWRIQTLSRHSSVCLTDNSNWESFKKKKTAATMSQKGPKSCMMSLHVRFLSGYITQTFLFSALSAPDCCFLCLHKCHWCSSFPSAFSWHVEPVNVPLHNNYIALFLRSNISPAAFPPGGATF